MWDDRKQGRQQIHIFQTTTKRKQKKDHLMSAKSHEETLSLKSAARLPRKDLAEHLKAPAVKCREVKNTKVS